MSWRWAAGGGSRLQALTPPVFSPPRPSHPDFCFLIFSIKPLGGRGAPAPLHPLLHHPPVRVSTGCWGGHPGTHLTPSRIRLSCFLSPLHPPLPVCLSIPAKERRDLHLTGTQRPPPSLCHRAGDTEVAPGWGVTLGQGNGTGMGGARSCSPPHCTLGAGQGSPPTLLAPGGGMWHRVPPHPVPPSIIHSPNSRWRVLFKKYMKIQKKKDI